jgi:hypothetical protein
VAAALDDLRQRGRYFTLPEPKDLTESPLCKIAVAMPAQCDLTLLGVEEVLGKGATWRWDRLDPAPDRRQWTVYVKAGGALSKEKPIADFVLKEGALSFQWRAGGQPAHPPLGWCLLRVSANGEQETCQLSPPADCPPANVTIGQRAPLLIKLPPGATGQTSPCQLEVLPQDFTTVQAVGSATLKPGEKAVLKVTGTATGKHPVELELELEYKLAIGEVLITVQAFASTPDTAPKGNNARPRELILVSNYERQKKTLQGSSKNKESDVKGFARDIAALEKEQSLLSAPGRPPTQQSVQRLALVRAQLAQSEQLQDEADELFQKFSAGHSWYSDMLTLIYEVQGKAKLGFRVFRPVGADLVEIARPPQGP